MRVKVRKECRRFVKGGFGGNTIWSEAKEQIICGKDAFVNTLIDSPSRRKNVPEIPK